MTHTGHFLPTARRDVEQVRPAPTSWHEGKTTDSGKEPADADPCPHEHERRRLRDHTGRVAGAARRPGLPPRREPRHPGVPRELRGGADGPHDVRARPHQRPVAVANLNAFVLGSQRPSGTPDNVVSNSDPRRLLEKLRAANQGGDVHLVGGPRTIETFRALGALDELQLVVLPLLFGAGMRLTPSLSPDARLTFERERALPGGSVEIVYAVSGRASGSPAREAGLSPASQ